MLDRLCSRMHYVATMETTDDPSAELAQRWDNRKSSYMEESLGREHDMVMHAIIPYAVGGALDLYYFPHGRPGTAIATKELCELPDEGPSNDAYGCYELVMFTKHALDLRAATDESTEFGRAHISINAILNAIAAFSTQARLNSNETCEFPPDFENKRIAGKCLIFDGIAHHSGSMVKSFGLLAVIEIFRSEMKYAMENGGAKLLAKLRAAGHYPYSDLDRKPVV